MSVQECARALDLIEDGLHGRLEPDASRFLARHLAACDGCAQVHERIDRQRAMVAGLASRPVAPPAFRAAIRARLRRPSLAVRLRPVLTGALVASAVLALALLSGRVVRAPETFEVLAREAVDDHIRVVLRQRTGARGPSDAAELQALMEPAVNYRVPRPGEGDERFVLAGGRPSYINGQAVACFYYRAPAAYASLFVVPAANLRRAATRFASTPGLSERGAYRLVYWRQDDYAYVLVSDAPASEVLPLAQSLQRT